MYLSEFMVSENKVGLFVCCCTVTHLQLCLVAMCVFSFVRQFCSGSFTPSHSFTVTDKSISMSHVLPTGV
jgi:hypothetical protein